MQTTSEDKGIPFLEAHEGVVLTAYRCPAGKWTIGAGLTAASGVVTPRGGMTITRAEASRLLKLALARNYEPAVRQAPGRVASHAFDGAVSFHFNTGAIGRASWVGSYKARDWTGVGSRLALWNKGGGRVLPGLERRRREEADAILLDKWPADLCIASGIAAADPQYASFVISVSASEIAEIREALREVGFEPGVTAGKVDRQAVLDFQRHYGLTVDGLIGKRTLSALQRELDARRRSRRHNRRQGRADCHDRRRRRAQGTGRHDAGACGAQDRGVIRILRARRCFAEAPSGKVGERPIFHVHMGLQSLIS